MRHRIARALCGIIGAATILAGVGFASAAPPSSPEPGQQVSASQLPPQLPLLPAQPLQLLL